MRINSITTTGVASAVWANATRTLTADPATDAGAATLVWARVTRALTNLGVVTGSTGIGSSLAASSTADLRPAAGLVRHSTIHITAGAAGAGNISLYDGTTLRTVSSIAAGAVGGTYLTGQSGVGQAVRNTDGANALTYAFAIDDWKV